MTMDRHNPSKYNYSLLCDASDPSQPQSDGLGCGARGVSGRNATHHPGRSNHPTPFITTILSVAANRDPRRLKIKWFFPVNMIQKLVYLNFIGTILCLELVPPPNIWVRENQADVTLLCKASEKIRSCSWTTPYGDQIPLQPDLFAEGGRLMHYANDKDLECGILITKLEVKIEYYLLELQWRQEPPCSSWDTGRVAPLLFSPGG